jgi:formimidoylglutamate deiminase
MRLRFKHLFTGSCWRADWLLDVNDAGIIVASEPASGRQEESLPMPGIAIPGFINVHSHAFQRALAGLGEYRIERQDSFWTWRRWMYRLVEHLTPDDEYAIARQLYLEMLRAGYTAVGEFHYIHRDTAGTPYDDPLTMSEPLVRAATDVGIQICLLPVLYQCARFGSGSLAPAQRRFVLDDESFMNLVRRCHDRWGNEPGVAIGLAVHSLRAVQPQTIAELFPILLAEFANAPAHIHVAEQLQEVEDCLRNHQRRPVELLMDYFDIDRRWCLIHATHMTERERNDLVQCQAVVGLCPSTEANLGDGVFPAVEYCMAGGHFSIGSDSQVTIDPRTELRWLEYGQRMTRRARNLLCDAERSVGRYLCEHAWQGGRQALRRPIGRLEVGDSADFLLLDPQHPSLVARESDRILDGLVFCEHGSPIERVFVRGQMRWPQEDQQATADRYQVAVRRLAGLMT